ncbi:ComEC/Rec2-related protein [Segniliparus rotundus DSM 44985]|uniref:ComEC/Rec2-related protein n=1 Tax=Segniliparus rotundus (strain ATCC BAA-972 / CDC 1076 / CIP 108378 / DSM 44985 / JCM 13578) TaxID=640132 RepID=D6ZEW1_SEGRD|nr:ComEC/Rec2 family competence protein [Segniliparus rotundus]ADG97485.1 ComEC/Rec2-related protein [Segniliparus rotundus DSM 44985]
MIGPPLGVWAGAALTLALGWQTGAAVSALGAVSMLALAALAVRFPALHARLPRWCLVTLALLAVSAAVAAEREHARADHPLSQLARGALIGAPEHGGLLVTVWTTDDPRPIRGNRVLIPGELRSPWTGASVVVLAPRGAYENLAPWQSVTFAAKASPPRRHDLTAASLSAVGPPQAVGPASWAATTTGGLRRRFVVLCERTLPEDESMVLPAVVFGDTSRISGKLKDEFRNAGLTHLMVVSGANFAIVLGAVLLLLRVLGAGPRLASVVAFAVLIGLVLLVRPSPSVLRAAVMGALALFALYAGRRAQPAHALGLAVVVLLLFDPALALDYGFVLSVLATGALVRLAPRWQKMLAARGAPPALAGMLAAAAAAHMATAPVVAMLTGEVSLVGLIANVLVEPVIGLVTVLGCSGAAAAVLWEPAGELIVRFAGVPMTWLVMVARSGAACPFGVVRTGSGGAGFLMTAAALLVLAGVLWLLTRGAGPLEGALPHGVSIIHHRRAGSGRPDLRRIVHPAQPAARPRSWRGHDP